MKTCLLKSSLVALLATAMTAASAFAEDEGVVRLGSGTPAVATANDTPAPIVARGQSVQHATADDASSNASPGLFQLLGGHLFDHSDACDPCCPTGCDDCCPAEECCPTDGCCPSGCCGDGYGNNGCGSNGYGRDGGGRRGRLFGGRNGLFGRGCKCGCPDCGCEYGGCGINGNGHCGCNCGACKCGNGRCRSGFFGRHCAKYNCRRHAANACINNYLFCKLGYFIPTGCGGVGCKPFGCYSIVYPENPGYFDGRDGQVYAAQGYGGPISVPTAPNVRHAYNYGWGVPSSRLTPISNAPY